MIVVESLINNVTYVVELSDVSTLSISQAIAAKNTSELVLQQVNNQKAAIDLIATNVNQALESTQHLRNETLTLRTQTQTDRTATETARNETLTLRTQTQTDRTATETARNEALQAVSTISTINLSGAQNLDLLMRQSGVFSRVTPANLGAIRELFRLAIPPNSYFNVKQIVAWDNADKTVPNGSALTTLDSGQSWQSFIGPHTIAYRQGPGELGIFRGTSTNATDNWSSVIPWGLGSIGIEWTHRRTTLGADSGVIIAARDTSNYLVFQRFMPEQFTGGLAAGGDHRLISVVNGVGTVLATFTQAQIFGVTNNDDGFNLVPVTWIIKYGHLGRNNTSQILIFLKHNPAVRVELNVTSLNTVYASAANLAFTGLMGDSLSEGATTRYIVARLI